VQQGVCDILTSLDIEISGDPINLKYYAAIYSSKSLIGKVTVNLVAFEIGPNGDRYVFLVKP
jgi:hypothetical protein